MKFNFYDHALSSGCVISLKSCKKSKQENRKYQIKSAVCHANLVRWNASLPHYWFSSRSQSVTGNEEWGANGIWQVERVWNFVLGGTKESIGRPLIHFFFSRMDTAHPEEYWSGTGCSGYKNVSDPARTSKALTTYSGPLSPLLWVILSCGYSN